MASSFPSSDGETITYDQTPQPNKITLLIGWKETRFLVHESHIHLSSVLREMCCGTLHDPEEPGVIRLPAESPELFGQILECLYTKNFTVKIDMAARLWNVFSLEPASAPAINGEGAGIDHQAKTTQTSNETMRRSQVAINNLAQVYTLALKYQIHEVQALALKKMTHYLDPMAYPEGFLWQVSLIYEEVPGSAQILHPYLKRALGQIERKGEDGRGLIQAYIQQGGEFAEAVWRECYEDDPSVVG